MVQLFYCLAQVNRISIVQHKNSKCGLRVVHDAGGAYCVENYIQRLPTTRQHDVYRWQRTVPRQMKSFGSMSWLLWKHYSERLVYTRKCGDILERYHILVFNAIENLHVQRASKMNITHIQKLVSVASIKHDKRAITLIVKKNNPARRIRPRFAWAKRVISVFMAVDPS